MCKYYYWKVIELVMQSIQGFDSRGVIELGEIRRRNKRLACFVLAQINVYVIIYKAVCLPKCGGDFCCTKVLTHEACYGLTGCCSGQYKYRKL